MNILKRLEVANRYGFQFHGKSPRARIYKRRAYRFFCPPFSTFAHVSFNCTVRLNTGIPAAESLSMQKYPIRSNW